MKKAASLIAGALIMTIIISSCATAPVPPVNRSRTSTIANAVYEGYVTIQGMIPAKRRVAVIGVTGYNLNETTWVREELTHLLVNAKRHKVLDRRRLGADFAETMANGEIEESSAKDIGYLLGAEVVVFGNISYHQGTQIRFLRIKAMDVRSGNIIAFTSERFNAS
jgi:hypothetical protein